ncbi:AsnC family transcriptional regulator [Candidatus Bathyarchaeota archaeon]|nr:AsnC family transcriptional regulator [Candidatus Bathyarchaeota archaeon]
MIKLDELDHEILELLGQDSRQSYREIAKKLEVSHVSISNRIKKMEEEGIILGYSTVLNPEKLGFYPLCLRISPDSRSDLSKVGRTIAENREIKVVLRVSGECELLALAMCEDREKAIDLLNELHKIPGIHKAESHVVLDTIKLSGIQLKT